MERKVSRLRNRGLIARQQIKGDVPQGTTLLKGVPLGNVPLDLFLAPGVLRDLSAEMLDGIDKELGEVNGVVNITAGLLLAELEVIARPERGGVERVAVVAVGLVGINDTVAVEVVEEIGVGVLVVGDRQADAVSVGLELDIERIFQPVELGLERLAGVAIGIVVGDMGRTDALNLEFTGVAGMGLGNM